MCISSLAQVSNTHLHTWTRCALSLRLLTQRQAPGQARHMQHDLLAFSMTPDEAGHGMQELQARVAAQQEACAKKDAELDAVYRHREELEALLDEANTSGSDRQNRSIGPSQPALMLPAPSESQVGGGFPAVRANEPLQPQMRVHTLSRALSRQDTAGAQRTLNALMMPCSPNELSGFTSFSSHGVC